MCDGCARTLDAVQDAVGDALAAEDGDTRQVALDRAARALLDRPRHWARRGFDTTGLLAPGGRHRRATAD